MKAKCGKTAGALIPRLGMLYACVLESGHTGECQKGGNCFKHGEYVGEHCPKWPDCIPTSLGLQREAFEGLFFYHGKTFQQGQEVFIPARYWKPSDEPECSLVTLPGYTEFRFAEGSWPVLEVQHGRLVIAAEIDQKPDDKMPCGHRRANEVGDECGTPYCELCRAIAIARLEEFDHIKANRPLDPVYWDKHHRENLEAQANGKT